MPDKKTIAVTVADENGLSGQVHQHFGHTPYFLLVDIIDGKTDSTRVIANPYAVQHQPGEVPAFVKAEGAEVIISGGMGERAMQIFTSQGISVATGAKGTAKDAVAAYLAGDLHGWDACDGDTHHHGDHDHH